MGIKPHTGVRATIGTMSGREYEERGSGNRQHGQGPVGLRHRQPTEHDLALAGFCQQHDGLLVRCHSHPSVILGCLLSCHS